MDIDKVYRFFPYLFNAVWVLPCLLIIRIIGPVYKVRFCWLLDSRLGHFASDAGHHLCHYLDRNEKYSCTFYYISKKTCNAQWAKMIRRELPVFSCVKYFIRFNNLLPGGSGHILPSSTQISRDPKGLIMSNNISYRFLTYEESYAKNWMKERGWVPGMPFACILVRDDAYLDTEPLIKKNIGNWNYHRFRNSNIETYSKAIKWLADQGYFVIRIGKYVQNKLNFYHENVLDYPFENEKNDLLDIWFSANCDLAINTGSGPIEISRVYRRPMLLLNHMPLGDHYTYANSVHFFKHLYWSESGDPLTMEEYLEHHYREANHYSEKGIVIEDLHEDEILEAIQEEYARLNDTWSNSQEDARLHELYWEKLSQWPLYNEYHGWIHPKACAGTSWLRRKGMQFFK